MGLMVCCTRIVTPMAGLVTLDAELIENLDPAGSGILGQSPRESIRFMSAQVNEDGMVEEVDMSDLLLQRAEGRRRLMD